jgi:hypothetical protein
MKEFKIGDKVKCIENFDIVGPSNPDKRVGGSGWKKDRIFIIDRIDKYSDYQILWSENEDGVYSFAVKLVFPFTIETIYSKI